MRPILVPVTNFQDEKTINDSLFIRSFLPCSGTWDFLRRNTHQPTAGLRLSMGFGMEKKIIGTIRHWKMSGGLISEIT